MKIKTKVLLLGIVSSIAILSCDKKTHIAIVKNNTKSSLFYTIELNKDENDSTVYKYYNTFTGNIILPQSDAIITVPNRGIPGPASDPEKFNLTILNVDSLNSYLKLKKRDNVLKYSLVKIINIQLNKIKYPLDTIYIR